VSTAANILHVHNNAACSGTCMEQASYTAISSLPTCFRCDVTCDV
jgi:hypothetical protein